MAGRLSRRDPGENDPVAWREGSARAREARGVVAVQLSEAIVSGDLTGSKDFAALHLRNVADAERRGDPLVVRAAVLETSHAFAAWAVQLDLATPAPPPDAPAVTPERLAAFLELVNSKG